MENATKRSKFQHVQATTKYSKTQQLAQQNPLQRGSLTTYPCAQCKQQREKSCFSKSQWRAGADKRKCLQCTGAPVNNLQQSTQVMQQPMFNTKPKPPSVPPNQSWCTQCGQGKSRSEFSKSQLSRPTTERRCKECTGAPSGPSIKSGSSVGNQPQQNAEIQCITCQQMVPRGNFSSSQLAKPLAKRQCKNCVSKQVAQLQQVESSKLPLQGIRICAVCKQIKQGEDFSRSQWGKGDDSRKCKECAAKSVALVGVPQVQKDRKQELLNTRVVSEKIDSLNALISTGKNYIETCAQHLDQLNNHQISQVFIYVEKTCAEVLACRGKKMDGKTLGQTLNHLRHHRLFSKNQIGTYLEVLLKNRNEMTHTLNRTFSDEEKKVILQTAYDLVNYIDQNIVPFISSDLMEIESSPNENGMLQ